MGTQGIISVPGGKPKLPTGNGRDLPHMQSSLSPQGYGLYNSIGGFDDGGGDAPLALAKSRLSPRNKQTFQYNDYLIASPNTLHKQQEYTAPIFPCDDGRGWRDPRGNENLATHNNFGGGGGAGGGSYLNATSAPSFDSSKVIPNLPPPSSSLKMGPQQNSPYKKPGERLADTGNGKAITSAATPTTMRGGRIIPGSVELDRDKKKEHLIDSLSQSDMITCLPGFKRRPTQFPPQRRSWPPNDQVVHRISQQGLNMMDYQSAPTRIVEGSPAVPSSYARQAPASHSPVLNYSGEEVRSVADDGEIGRYIANSDRNPRSFAEVSNPIMDPNNNIRPIPPCSPITRAKAAIGQAQSEVLKINSFMEEERDRQKPHGAWKNMGTPFFSGSEPVLKSAERQQKVQYRIDLERQILASKMRKAEQERKEKEGTDHPLGPEYAHPALTYYNPPQKIINSGSTAPTSPKAAALTKYMKEKYALGNPSSSARNKAAPSSSPMIYPQEMGSSRGTLAGKMEPLQQTKMEKVLGNSNLMKPRVQVGDQNLGTVNRFPPQQNQPQQPIVPGSMGRPLNQQQQVPSPALPPHYGYPAGVQHPARQYGYAMNPWQMYQHPAYAQYYGQLGAGNSGHVNPQQAAAAAQYYQQQNHCPSPAAPLPSQSSTSQPYSQRFEDQQFDRSIGSGDGHERDDEDDPDFDFEALKEVAYKSQKIWQTSDELPDPGLRAAVYKAELRKQIDEDRMRKAEKVAREKLEDERIEKKIREFQEEERRKVALEERTRAELEEYQTKTKVKTQQQNRRRKNEAFTISQNSGRHQRQGGMNLRRRRQRPRSPPMNDPPHHHPQPHPGMGAGDFDDMNGDQFNNNYQFHPYNHLMMEDQNARLCADDMENSEFLPYPKTDDPEPDPNQGQPLRKASPPVPVVQRKLLQDKTDNFDNRIGQSDQTPATKICPSPSQNFFHQLKERLKSEKDLVERRLQEKVESTHKNLNLLKYTLNHD